MSFPLGLFPLLMAEVSGYFFIFLSIAVMDVFCKVKRLMCYRNCDRGGIYRNGEERKESYFPFYPISYPFSVLGACQY